MTKIRGVVIESEPGRVIVMREDGTFKRVRTSKPLYEGQLYTERTLAPGRLGAVAAVFLVVLLGTIDFFNVVAYAYLTPGVEMGLNRWNRVVEVTTSGTEAGQLIEEISLTGETIEDAVQAVMKKAMDTETVGDQGSEFTVVVWCKDKQNSAAQSRIMVRIDDALGDRQFITGKIKHRKDGSAEELKIQVNQGNHNGQLKENKADVEEDSVPSGAVGKDAIPPGLVNKEVVPPGLLKEKDPQNNQQEANAAEEEESGLDEAQDGEADEPEKKPQKIEEDKTPPGQIIKSEVQADKEVKAKQDQKDKKEKE